MGKSFAQYSFLCIRRKLLRHYHLHMPTLAAWALLQVMIRAQLCHKTDSCSCSVGLDSDGAVHSSDMFLLLKGLETWIARTTTFLGCSDDSML